MPLIGVWVFTRYMFSFSQVVKRFVSLYKYPIIITYWK